MTLYKQLTTWILAIFILFSLTVTASHFSSLRDQIALQAYVRLHHDILSAEAAVKPSLISQNTQQLTSVIEQVFSGQDWFRFRLILSQNKGVIEKQRPVNNDEIPNWFVNLGLFEPLTKSHTISYGWEQLATLSITADSISANRQLWQAIDHLILTTLLSLIVSVTVIIVALRRGLKPLDTIVHRAQNLATNQFGSPIPQPSSNDLRIIVKTINHLSSQLEINFKTQAREAAKLREQVYRDSVSGMGNRSFFISQLNSWLAKSPKGGLALLKTSLIEDCYQNHGFNRGDQLVKEIATGLNEGIIYNDITLARLSYDEFALLAPDISADKLKIVGETMLSVIDDLQSESAVTIPHSAHVGLLLNHQPSTSSTLLSQLDNALSKAALTPQQPITLIKEGSAQIAFGKQQWKSLLVEAIDNDLFIYHFQPVANNRNGIYHHEVFSAIKTNNDVYTASQFLGAIEDLGIGSLFDRHVVAQLINRLNADHQLGPLAINITHSSICEPAFIRWLSKILEHNQSLSSRLFFELPEASFVRHPDATNLLCSAIRFYKFRFGVDNYGRHFKSLDYLTEFRPDYVKIDFVYTHQLNDQSKSRLLSSISRTAHSLNIMTIATRVETETQLERLSELFVSGFQGFIIERFNAEQQTEQLNTSRLPVGHSVLTQQIDNNKEQ
ncbi:EAL domain-containing protein [Photobacterium chitinilyticum]|uniref:bifunctional diguanylate cyclase/phosphodiesterase n=1 Tax=Photobacterium chitinilyticum TaxID=2485123 RepID=UPI003D0D65B9